MALTDLEKVRLAIGDTDINDRLIEDDEIDYLLTVDTDVVKAAIQCCRVIIAKMGRYVDSKRGRTWERASQITKHYKDLMTLLQQRVATSSNSLYAGGISDSDKESREADTDRTKPLFQKGMHDGPAASDLDVVDRNE